MTWPIVVLILGFWFGLMWGMVQVKRIETYARQPKGLEALFGRSARQDPDDS